MLADAFAAERLRFFKARGVLFHRVESLAGVGLFTDDPE